MNGRGWLPLRRPRLVLAAVAIVVLVAGLPGWSAPSHLSDRESDFHSHISESFETADELARIQPRNSLGVPDLAVITKGGERAGERTITSLERLPQVGRVMKRIFPSRDRRSNAVLAWLREDLPEEPAAVEVARELDRPGVLVGGAALTKYQFGEQIKKDLWRAELIAFPLLMLLGLWVFRSVAAALLPVLVGGIALLCGLGCLRGLNAMTPISIFSLNLAAGLSLGLGVDYSLLMVSRFREELAAGRSAAEAIRTTVRTTGRTVAFSAASIAAAFSSLLVFPVPFIRSIAVAGIAVALIAGVAALIVLPALFSLLGTRIDTLAPGRWRRAITTTSRPRREGGWYRLARFVMRRPFPVALASAGVMIALGIPTLGMRYTGLDAGSLPPTASARVFTEQVRDQFESPLIGEIAVAIHGDAETASVVAARVERLASSSGLATPSFVRLKHSSRLMQVDLNPTGQVFGEGTRDFVDRLRQMNAPVTVTGDTAAYVDVSEVLTARLPIALGILAGTSLVFLFLATGSLILPIKALIMNVLSLSASFGLLVLVFQDGRLESVLNYDSQGALLLAMPVVLGAGAFGLLTDYGLFLLMRIKERREAGYPDREAIAWGLERTGRIVTAAALLFCTAVGAFATSEISLIKEGAIGISVAVALDAFIVRPLLVPSLMAILGRWNWWPRVMDESLDEAAGFAVAD